MTTYCSALALLIFGAIFPVFAQDTNRPHNPPGPSAPIPVPSRFERKTTEAAGNGLEKINDLLSGWIADSEIEKARQRIAPVVDKLTPKEGDGYLLRIDLYESSNGQKVLGNGGNIDQIGPGRTQEEAAEKYLTSDHISAQPPSGLLRNKEDSFFIWLQRTDGKLIETKIPYPFADLTFIRARMRADHDQTILNRHVNEALEKQAQDEARQQAEKRRQQQRQQDKNRRRAQQLYDDTNKSRHDSSDTQQQRQRQQQDQEQQAQRDRDRRREEEDLKERQAADRDAALKRHEEEARGSGRQGLPSPTNPPKFGDQPEVPIRQH